MYALLFRLVIQMQPLPGICSAWCLHYKNYELTELVPDPCLLLSLLISSDSGAVTSLLCNVLSRFNRQNSFVTRSPLRSLIRTFVIGKSGAVTQAVGDNVSGTKPWVKNSWSMTTSNGGRSSGSEDNKSEMISLATGERVSGKWYLLCLMRA